MPSNPPRSGETPRRRRPRLRHGAGPSTSKRVAAPSTEPTLHVQGLHSQPVTSLAREDRLEATLALGRPGRVPTRDPLGFAAGSGSGRGTHHRLNPRRRRKESSVIAAPAIARKIRTLAAVRAYESSGPEADRVRNPWSRTGIDIAPPPPNRSPAPRDGRCRSPNPVPCATTRSRTEPQNTSKRPVQHTQATSPPIDRPWFTRSHAGQTHSYPPVSEHATWTRGGVGPWAESREV